MVAKFAVLGIYVLAVLVIAYFARRKSSSAEDYYLAGRSLSPLILLATIAATNFSAFTIFGCSGEGYRAGLAFLPVMAFGTGFMALTFWLIGRKAWQLSKQHGLVTPAELVGKIYSNKWVSLLFAVVMVVWTVPYLALQPMAGGIVLNSLFGIDQAWGAVIVTGIIVLYTLRGGLRAVAWTDALQGIIMLSMMAAALYIIASAHGGLVPALSQAYEQTPELFSRPGLSGRYLPGIFFSMIFLWFFCDPMFPQLFQRFMAAKSERALAFTMSAYPLVCSVIFTISILIGVLGHLSIPGLVGREADQVLPLLMNLHAGEIMTALVLMAGLAALMSTMDSQLLTLSSIVTRDIMPTVGIPKDKFKVGGQLIVVLLAIAGLVVALNPIGSMIKVGFLAFTGLAALFPTVLFGMYLRRLTPLAAIFSIIAGQVVLVAYHTGLLQAEGYLSALPVVLVSLAVYVVTHLITQGPLRFPSLKLKSLYLGVGCLAVFILSMDFWNWNATNGLVFGLPLWIWYSYFLSAVLTGLMVIISRSSEPHTADKLS